MPEVNDITKVKPVDSVGCITDRERREDYKPKKKEEKGVFHESLKRAMGVIMAVEQRELMKHSDIELSIPFPCSFNSRQVVDLYRQNQKELRYILNTSA